jgi:flagellar basal body-associated protein FliL
MARKRGSFGKLMVLVVLTLAAFGGYTIWTAKPTQNGIATANGYGAKVEKAAKAAETAWK